MVPKKVNLTVHHFFGVALECFVQELRYHFLALNPTKQIPKESTEVGKASFDACFRFKVFANNYVATVFSAH